MIRDARIEDVGSVLELQEGAYWTETDLRNGIRSDLVLVLIAEQETAVGYAIAFVVPSKRSEAIVHEVFVSPGHRRSGIGSALLERTCGGLHDRGVRTVFSGVEVTDEEARAFYGSCGFSTTRTSIEVERSL